jgi:hypothetical protein
MAFLWWNSSIRELTPGVGHIGGLKIVIENELKGLGFSDVVRNDLEVAGNKPGIRVSIGHFHIADRRFWEVVMAAGDNEQTKAANDEVVQKIQSLVFFD